jgi:imidazolonepropionase-like amidohydrolase
MARRGGEMKDASVMTGAAVAFDEGRIAAVGPQDDVLRKYSGADVVDCDQRVITPGLVTDRDQLDAGSNNYLAAVELGEGAVGLALLDLSTGELRAAELADAPLLLAELGRAHAREVLMGQGPGTAPELAQVEAMPTCGLLKSASAKPTARSMPREGACFAPSTTRRE